MHVRRGQLVILCTKITTTPSTVPKEKHVISVSKSLWLVTYRGVSKTLYTCSRGSCKQWSNSLDVNYTRYSVVTDKCLAITDVKMDEVYTLNVYFTPTTPHKSNVSFYMKYDGEYSRISYIFCTFECMTVR